MKRIEPLRNGQNPTRDMYNKIVASVNSLLNMSGRDGIDARVTNNGVTITGNEAALRRTSTQLRRAFVKGTPSASSTVADCYLDSDSSSSQLVSVQINPIYAGGGNLGTAEPDLDDGVEFLVWNDEGTWRNSTTFFKVGDCDAEECE